MVFHFPLMASRRANSSSADCLVNTSEQWSLESICSGNIHLNLIYDRKRIKWTNNFELLKEFMERNVKEPGKWTSPGGNSRRFTSLNSDLCLTWYFDKQKTLLFQGKSGESLREILVNLCEKIISTAGDCPAGDTNRSNGNHIGEPLNPICGLNTVPPEPQTSRLTCNCPCENVSMELEDMKLNFEVLQSRVDSLQSLANTFEICKPANADAYASEIECLKRELSDEKKKSEQFRSELVFLKENISNFTDLESKSKRQSNPINKINFTPGETSLISDLTARHVIESDESNQVIVEKVNEQQNQRSISLSRTTRNKRKYELNNINTINDTNANIQHKTSKLAAPNQQKANSGSTLANQSRECNQTDRAPFLTMHTTSDKVNKNTKKVKASQGRLYPLRPTQQQPIYIPPDWLNRLPLIDIPNNKANSITDFRADFRRRPGLAHLAPSWLAHLELVHQITRS